jgi:hypothetical protein
LLPKGRYQPIIKEWHFRPGQSFVLRMQEATAEADLTIAVLSEAYLKAEFKWLTKEAHSLNFQLVLAQ